MLQKLGRCIPTAAPKGPHTGTLTGRVRADMALGLNKTVAPKNLNRSLHVLIDGLARPVLLMGPQATRPNKDLSCLCEHPAPKVLGDIDLMPLARLSVRHIWTIRPNDHVRLN